MEKIEENKPTNTTVYFLPNGSVEIRKHASGDFGGPAELMQRAFMAIELCAPREDQKRAEVNILKFRGDLQSLFSTSVEAFLSEKELLDRIMNDTDDETPTGAYVNVARIIDDVKEDFGTISFPGEVLEAALNRGESSNYWDEDGLTISFAAGLTISVKKDK